MRLGVVVARYGPDVVGGAELAARLLSERLATRGHSIEVFSTTAVDATTWASALPAGTTIEAGVTVQRFPAAAQPSPPPPRFSEEVLSHPEATPMEVARRWIEAVGPVCPAAIDAAEASECDLVAFHPYLFHPTVTGVPRLGDRAVLHPSAHDEPPIRLAPYSEVFAAAAGLVFWTEVERQVTERLVAAAATRPQIVLGFGVEPGAGAPEVAAAALGVDGRPYLLCLGRILVPKGTTLLAEWFAAWKRRNPGPLRLVLAGPVDDRPPSHPDIVVTGPVEEAVKWGLLRGAIALVSPSPHESLSLVVLEAWSVGTPVLVSGAGAVTKDHCLRSGGGLWFDGFGAFEAAVRRLAADPGLRRALGDAGRRYVEERYTWDRVLDRYERFLAGLVDRRLASRRR